MPKPPAVPLLAGTGPVARAPADPGVRPKVAKGIVTTQKSTHPPIMPGQAIWQAGPTQPADVLTMATSQGAVSRPAAPSGDQGDEKSDPPTAKKAVDISDMNLKDAAHVITWVKKFIQNSKRAPKQSEINAHVAQLGIREERDPGLRVGRYRDNPSLAVMTGDFNSAEESFLRNKTAMFDDQGMNDRQRTKALGKLVMKYRLGKANIYDPRLSRAQNENANIVQLLWQIHNSKKPLPKQQGQFIKKAVYDGHGQISEAAKDQFGWKRHKDGYYIPPNDLGKKRSEELGYVWYSEAGRTPFWIPYSRIPQIYRHQYNPPPPQRQEVVVNPFALSKRPARRAAPAPAARRGARRGAAARPARPAPAAPRAPVGTPRKDARGRAADAARRARGRRAGVSGAYVPQPVVRALAVAAPAPVGPAPQIAVRGRARVRGPRGPAPGAIRPPRGPRRNVHHVAPHLRTIASNHFKGVYRHDNITPALSLRTLAPGHFVVRASKMKGVRQHIISLLRRAPKSLWVNGHKHSKKQALGVILRLLEQRHAVDIQLSKI